jgi:hypothetical protein
MVTQVGCRLVVAVPNLVGFVKVSSKAAFSSSSRSCQAIASTHSATDDVDVERPLRSIRLLRIVEGMTSTIRFQSVYSSIGSKICLDIICSSRT